MVRNILFIRQLPKSRLFGAGAHQRQGKKSEKSEEKERDRGTEGEIPKPHLGQLMRSYGTKSRTESRREQKEETGSESPKQLPWAIQWLPTTSKDHTVDTIPFTHPPPAQKGGDEKILLKSYLFSFLFLYCSLKKKKNKIVLKNVFIFFFMV